jgi:O-antigen ligase
MSGQPVAALSRPRLAGLLEAALLALTLFLSTLRPLVVYSLYPDTAVSTGPAWREAFLWLLALLLGLSLMFARDLGPAYLSAVRKNWLLVALALFAAASLAWSTHPAASFYRLIGFLSATVIAGYFGVRYSPREWLSVLFVLGSMILILSLAFALAVPGVGRMLGATYEGAWRGIFWHKNHLGAMLALFSGVFAIRFLAGLPRREPVAVVDGVFYVFALFLLVKSDSAAGVLTALALSGLILLFWLWLRLAPRLRRVHYWSALGLAVLLGLLLLLRMDTFLGLFSRESSLTGRVPMWGIILRDYVSQRPFAGFGFGSIWSLESFRTALQHKAGWGFQILIADNGFVDILLQLGLVGLALFIALYARMWIQAGRRALARRTIEDFYPLLLMAFSLLANITFSLFFETETLVWLLMVSALFAITARDARLVTSTPGQ